MYKLVARDKIAFSDNRGLYHNEDSNEYFLAGLHGGSDGSLAVEWGSRFYSTNAEDLKELIFHLTGIDTTEATLIVAPCHPVIVRSVHSRELRKNKIVVVGNTKNATYTTTSINRRLLYAGADYNKKYNDQMTPAEKFPVKLELASPLDKYGEIGSEDQVTRLLEKIVTAMNNNEEVVEENTIIVKSGFTTIKFVIGIDHNSEVILSEDQPRFVLLQDDIVIRTGQYSRGDNPKDKLLRSTIKILFIERYTNNGKLDLSSPFDPVDF